MEQPLAQVGQFFQGVVDAAQRHPFAQNAAKALKRFQAQDQAPTRLPPRLVALPRHTAAIIPGDSTAELVLTNGINNFLNLYNSALVVRLVLTWFPNPPAAIVGPLATVCDPYLNLFRGLLPPLGGTLDFSPILAFVVLNLFTNTAAALPADIPKRGAAAAAAGALPAAEPSSSKWALMSKNEQMYQRRVAAQRSRSEDEQ